MAKKKRGKKVDIESISRKLDQLLEGQREILKEEKEELEEEEKIEALEKKEIEEEEKELSELEKLEKLEKDIAKQVGPHPLRQITYKDIARGAVGAFFGAVAHYTFIYGLKVAESIDMARAGILYALSFTIGFIFLYMTGFRKIKDMKVLSFLPIRLIVLYITSLIMSALVLLLFLPDFGQVFADSFKQLAAVTLTAIVGACTADLIGKH